jgi:hypothetical protein
MADRSKVLDRIIKMVAAPAIEKEGFRFDGKRAFRKVGASGRTCQIINFQVGKKFMLGEFTINLGVYSPDTSLGPDHPTVNEANEWNCLPDCRQRLGALIQSKWTKCWTSFFGESESAWWKHISYGSRDRWWKFSENEAETITSVQSALTHLQQLGFPWLARADNSDRMRAQYREITERVRARHNKSLKPTPPRGGAA